MDNSKAALAVLSGLTLLAGTLCGARLAAAQHVPSTGMQLVAGKILSIDPKAKLVKVESEEVVGSIPMSRRIEFVLADTTVITEGARRLQPQNLEVGTAVRVEYTSERGKHIARSISVQPAGESTLSPADSTVPAIEPREPGQAPPAQPFQPQR